MTTRAMLDYTMWSVDLGQVPVGNDFTTADDRVAGYQSPSESPRLLDWFHSLVKSGRDNYSWTWHWRHVMKDIQDGKQTLDAYWLSESLLPRLKDFLDEAYPGVGPPEPRPDWLQAFYGAVLPPFVGEDPKPVLWDDFDFALRKNKDRPVDLETILRQAISRVRDREHHLLTAREEYDKDRLARPFVGTAHQRLHSTLRYLNDSVDADVYARCLPLIQSSGMGKTRTAMEFGKLELGAYFCLRSVPWPKECHQPWTRTVGGYATRLRTTSFPHQDGVAVKYLQDTPDSDGDFEAVLSITAFLVGFFRVYGRLCSEEMGKLGEGCSRKGLAVHVAGLLADQTILDHPIGPGTNGSEGPRTGLTRRQQFLQDIDEEAARFQSGVGYGVWSRLSAMYFRLHLRKVRRQEEFFAIVLREEYWVLDRLFGPRDDEEGKQEYVHLVLDHAWSLGPNLIRLQRLLSYLTDLDFWIILVDTHWRTSEEIGIETNRQEASQDRRRSIGPFVELPQDVFLRSPERFGRYHEILSGGLRTTHGDLLQLLPLMGRPLWNDPRWNRSKKVGEFELKAIFEKLVNAPSVEFSKEEAVKDAWPRQLACAGTPMMFAAASQRVPLDLVGTLRLSEVDCQVANHLRIITYYNGRGIWGYNPSEPLLSLAVASSCRSNSEEFWSAALTGIWDRHLHKSLRIEKPGLDFYRIAMSVAMDLASQREMKSPADSDNDNDGHLDRLPWIANAEVWLGKLYGNQVGSRSKVQRWSQHRWINFTHFARQSENQTETQDKPISRERLMQLWTRQAALFKTSDEGNWNILVVTLKSITRPKVRSYLDPADLLPILIRVEPRPSSYYRKTPWEKLARSALSRDNLIPGALYIHDNLDPRPHRHKSFRYVKTPSDKPLRTVLCLYVGGGGVTVYPIVKHLTNDAQQIMGNFLPQYATDYMAEHGANGLYMQDVFGDHALHAEAVGTSKAKPRKRGH